MGAECIDGHGMPRGPAVEIGVEMRSNRTHEWPAARGHHHPIAHKGEKLVGVVQGIVSQFAHNWFGARPETSSQSVESRSQKGI